MTRLAFVALVAVCAAWALAVFVACEAQATWRRLRGLPELDERFA